MCQDVCIEVNEIVENITIEFHNTVENISVEVRDFSVSNIISQDVGNIATIGNDGLLFVPEIGGGSVESVNGILPDVNGNVVVPIPIKTSDLLNDGSDGTSTYVETDELGATAFSNDYNDLNNLPTIPTVPSFADQTETNAGVVTNKTIAPNTLSGWWTYQKGLIQTFAQKITFSLGALFTPQATPTHERGRVYFDDSNDCLAYMDSVSGTSVQMGQEIIMRVRNNTGATILNGSVVYVSGAIGQNSTIALAQANTIPTSEIIGMATHDILNNTVGKVCVFGQVNDLDTSDFNDGDAVFLSSTIAGGLVDVVPVSPNFVVAVGVVEHSHPTQGKILVRPQRALANNNVLGIGQSVSATQNSVKTYVDNQDALKLDKVATVDVEKVYIKNADGTQGMKATSDFKDVLEFADLASFPVTGETGKIYLALDTNKTYRWSGSVYVKIGGEQSFTVIGKNVVDSSPVTGTTIETTVETFVIPANTFQVGDCVLLRQRALKTGALGTFRNTAQIGTWEPLYLTTAANQLYSQFERLLVIKSPTNSQEFSNSRSALTSNIQQFEAVSHNIDWTISQDLNINVRLTDAADSVVVSYWELIRIR